MTRFFVSYLHILFQGERAPPGAPWPLPQEWSQSNELLTLDPKNFNFRSNLVGCDVIDEAFNRYRPLLNLDEEGRSDDDLDRSEGLDVTVTSEECDDYPEQAADESCAFL